MKLKKAFTIIELLVVITITSILASIGVGTYNGFVEDANNTRIIASTAEYTRALDRYYIINGEYPNPGDIEFYCLGNDPSCGVSALAYINPFQNIEFISTVNAKSRYSSKKEVVKKEAILVERSKKKSVRKEAPQKIQKEIKKVGVFKRKKSFLRNESLEKKLRKALGGVSEDDTYVKFPEISSVKINDTDSWSGLLYRCQEVECQSTQIIWVLGGKNKECKIRGTITELDDNIDPDKATLCSLSKSRRK